MCTRSQEPNDNMRRDTIRLKPNHPAKTPSNDVSGAKSNVSRRDSPNDNMRCQNHLTWSRNRHHAGEAHFATPATSEPQSHSDGGRSHPHDAREDDDEATLVNEVSFHPQAAWTTWKRVSPGKNWPIQLRWARPLNGVNHMIWSTSHVCL